jgi:hypothetical protein
MWIKVDDGFITHPKTLQAAELLGRYGLGRAIAGWLKGMSYAGRHQTDGFIPARTVRQIDDPRPNDVADALVSSGLWEAAEGGYRIHDYHDYNPKAEQVIAARKSQLQRQQAYLAKKLTRHLDHRCGSVDAVNDGVNDASSTQSTRARDPKPNPKPNPKPVPSGDGTAPAAPIARALRPVPLHNQKQHVGHAHCDLVCVPAFLHAEFRQGLNRPNDPDGADDELVKGYRAHCEGWPDGKPTGDPCAFWRAWYRARYPAPTVRDTKAQQNDAAIKAWLERDGAKETA